MTAEWEEAVRRGSVEELRRLLAGGADINARDQHGQTALMRAAVAGDDQVADWLIQQGANLNQTAKYGLSALMLAVVNGHAGIVRILLNAGANTGLRGGGAPGFASKTALDLAIDRNAGRIAELLRAHDAREVK